MNTSNYLVQEQPKTRQHSVKKSSKISFSSFQKLILANTEMRKQVKDIVDLALFDYALKQNEMMVQSIKEKAETETIRLMMGFLYGVSDYQALSKIIHRNWVIKTLAALDRKDQLELMDRVTHLKAV